ncbi:MAG: hypothetical protein LBV00_12820 [Propionibacteriaceae bacterium]|jgi:hypothetical protein|nr:hypothetical protein [Propionibacteriaceae bacterium]
MFKKMMRIVAAALCTAAMMFAAVTPAAHASLKLYAEPDFKASIGEFWSAMESPWNMSANADDTLSSFKNDTPYSVAFAHEKNLQGHCFSGTPGQHARSFYFWDDNHASSFQLGRSC